VVCVRLLLLLMMMMMMLLRHVCLSIFLSLW
jgi:hypothetical protein